MSILFVASALLWVKLLVTQLCSMVLCASTFSNTVEGLYFGWGESVIVIKSRFEESGVYSAIDFMWREMAVVLFSVLLFSYGVRHLAKTWMRGNPI